MSFGINLLSVIPVRGEPSDKSEMVSQLLFGETYEVVERQKSWLRIVAGFDSYPGWIDVKQHVECSPEQYQAYKFPHSVNLSPVAALKEPGILISSGSSLPGLQKNMLKLAGFEFEFTGESSASPLQPHPELIPAFAKRHLHTPYLWGGRSAFGADCSGFTQLVFKMAGIALRRDAWQQSETGTLVQFIDQSRPGDLAFFHNEEGRITHTGILLENQTIIHCSGKVRMDKIDHYGIYNEEKKTYTHLLRLIRRMIF